MKDKLLENRNKIDNIDKKILDLLNERAKCAVEIGKVKQSSSAVYVPSRESEIINFDFNKNNINIEFYFYLCLLIRYNPYTLDYDFDKEYILTLNKKEYNENNFFSKLIKAKIVIELSKEYIKIKGLEDNEEGNDLNNIIEKNKEIINNIIKSNLNDLDINWVDDYLISIPIDKFYIELIIAFINKKKFDNYENIYNIFITQLSLDKIDITKLMYEELVQYLDCDTNIIINDYKIVKEEDLNNELKINFNHFLLKYIFKNIYDINQFKYVYSFRNTLKKIIKSNPNITKNIISDKYKKLKEIFEMFYIKANRQIRNNLRKYYENFLSKKKT